MMSVKNIERRGLFIILFPVNYKKFCSVLIPTRTRISLSLHWWVTVLGWEYRGLALVRTRVSKALRREVLVVLPPTVAAFIVPTRIIVQKKMS